MTNIPEVENFLKNNTLVLQPDIRPEKKCSMLLLNNILHPEVIMVDCKSKLVTNRVICNQLKRKMLISNSLVMLSFPTNAMRISGSCYTTFYKHEDVLPSASVQISGILILRIQEVFAKFLKQ